MANIRPIPKDNPTRWEVRYSVLDEHGRRRQRGKTFRGPGAKALAERFKTKVEHERNEGTLRDPNEGKLTFSELVDEWKESQAWARLAGTTVSRYEDILKNHVLPHWKTTRVNRITYAQVDKWIGKLRKDGMKPASVHKVYGVWRSAISFAVKRHYLPDNPARGMELPSVPAHEALFLTAQELETLAGAVAPRYRAMVLTAGWLGLRASELVGLKRKRLDLLHKRLTVAEALVQVDGDRAEWKTPKNGKGREVVVPDFMVAVLDEHLRKFTEPGTGPDALVFSSPTGLPIRWQNFRQRDFGPVVRKVLPPNKRKLRFHDLRHTCASLMIETGVPLKMVSDQLGHSSISITFDRYGHLQPGVKDALSAGLDALYLEVDRRCDPAAGQEG